MTESGPPSDTELDTAINHHHNMNMTDLLPIHSVIQHDLWTVKVYWFRTRFMSDYIYKILYSTVVS